MAAKRLERLHTWNGWNLLFLFVSGAILYWPALRGATAPIRVPLKYLHIASGLTRYWKLRLLPVNTPLREDRRVLLAGAAAVLGAVLWGRLGRALPPIEPKPAEITERGRFRVYTVTDIPQFDTRTWRFTVSGLVNQPLTLSWDEFTQLPSTTQLNDFHCVTGWSVINVLWEGVKLADLLDRAGVKPEARFVKFISGDGVYTDSLDLSTARLGDVLLPWAMDGSPLPTALGGPVRLVVPEMYGYKSVKWLQAIELVATEHVGYWEERGYPVDAWLNREG